MKKNNMYQISVLLLSFFIFSCVVLTGCNSREDVSHMSVERMKKYVQKAIDEPVSFLELKGKEEDNKITYVFNLDERNIHFDVVSIISAPFIDGAQFGNYKEKIYIYYEDGIVNSEEYTKKREELALKHGVNEIIEYRDFYVEIENYNEMKKLSEYYLELDQLYSFKEKKPYLIVDRTSGIIGNDDFGYISGISFSTNSNDRLKYDEIYHDLEEKYVGHLKYFNFKDKTVPKDVWSKYEANP